MAETRPPGRIWIVGATSFFGRFFAQTLSARGYEVFGIARRHLGDARAWGFKHVETGPFSSELLTRLMEQFGAPGLLLHCVGSGSVGEALAAPDEDFERTVTSLRSLINFIRLHAPSARLIYPSSAAVYGDVDADPITETTPTRPVSIYGQNKVEAENLCYAATNLDIVVIRLFSVFGAPQRKLLFWDIGQRLLAGQGSIILNGTGHETRDFTHVSDAANATAILGLSGCPPRVVNVGTGTQTSVKTAITILAETLKITTPIVFNGAKRAGDPLHLRADIARLKALGFVPQTTLKDGLEEYAAWLQAKPARRLTPETAAFVSAARNVRLDSDLAVPKTLK